MPVKRLIGALLLAVLVLAGCGGKKSEPTLEVTAAQDGRNLKVQVSTQGYVIGKDGHVHIYLNDGPEAMIYGSTYTVENIEPGNYKIRVELANIRHENVGIGKTIEFEVKP